MMKLNRTERFKMAGKAKRSARGGGSVNKSGNNWRLRYWAHGKRRSKTVKGSKLDATRELRRLLDDNSPEPSKMTFSHWKTKRLAVKERSIKARTYERYDDVLSRYVEPHIGKMLLQRITAIDIDRIYSKLKLAPASAQLAHVVLKSCFASAAKKKLIAVNPVVDAEKPGGVVELEETETDVDGATLVRLVEAFRDHPSLSALVAVAAGTGMRRGELLALQWPAIDFSTATIAL